MTYVSWAALYEGPSDRAYFDVLIPRVMEDLTLQHGIRNCTIPPNPAMLLGRGTVEQVAKEACAAKDAFQLVFIHADTGGRNLESGLDNRSTAYCTAMNETCKWPSARCVVISPRHETEAWILCDPAGVASALGYTGNPIRIGLPASAVQAEGLTDPKKTLTDVAREVRGRRRPFDVHYLYASIAQRQALNELRRLPSYAEFERRLMIALADLGCVRLSADGPI